MTTSGNSYGVTNPATRTMKWFRLADFGGSKMDTMNVALRYEDERLSQNVEEGSIKFELLDRRPNTRKPSTDRRYRGNKETASASNTRSQIAVS